METESRFSALLARVMEKLQEQVWYQQARGKWEELDARTRTFVQLGAMGLLVLIVVGGALTMLISARSLRQELAEKTEILNMLQTANDEMRDLRSAGGSPMEAGGDPNWSAYFEATAANSGIARENLTVSAEKPGTGLDAAQEGLYDLSLKDVNARQLSRYAFFLENGGRPVKLRNLTIETREDLSGYLTATLSVSAFSPKE